MGFLFPIVSVVSVDAKHEEEEEEGHSLSELKSCVKEEVAVSLSLIISVDAK